MQTNQEDPDTPPSPTNNITDCLANKSAKRVLFPAKDKDPTTPTASKGSNQGKLIGNNESDLKDTDDEEDKQDNDVQSSDDDEPLLPRSKRVRASVQNKYSYNLFVEEEAEEEDTYAPLRLPVCDDVAPEDAGKIPSPNPIVKVTHLTTQQRLQDALTEQPPQDPDKSDNDKEDDDDSFDLDVYTVAHRPRIVTPPKSPSKAKAYKINYRDVYYQFERLQGNLTLFTGMTNDDTNPKNHPGFIFPATVQCNDHADTTFFTKYDCKGVKLADPENNEIPLLHPTKHKNVYGIIVSFPSKSLLADQNEFLRNLVEFSNDHYCKFNSEKEIEEAKKRQEDLPRFQIEKVTPKNHNTNEYHIMSDPDRTQKPKRKLGDTVLLSDAIGFLQFTVNMRVFNQFAYHEFPDLMKRLFNPPYSPLLQQRLGFPNDEEEALQQQNIL